jgi:prepilin-type N-terminal cleavage/methylation domain-containing protein
MLKKMNEKKNNKGFSLVELIVVILIMAVLAVALAPQVMKWVGNARKAADRQTVDAIVSGVQLAAAQGTVTDYNIKIEYSGGNWTANANGGGTMAPTDAQLNAVLGDTWKTTNALKSVETGQTVIISSSGAAITTSGTAPFLTGDIN